MIRIKFIVVVFVQCISEVCMTSLPNIVIFMADDLGIGDIGIFGNTSLRTPSIDRIGQEGVKLAHHLAADSVCTPSRAAFLTGRYPIRTGLASFCRAIPLLGSTAGLQPEEVTLAEQAKKAGYQTALIGKWHLGLFDDWRNPIYHPLNQGFDEFYGIPYSSIIDFELPFYDVNTVRFNPVHFYLLQIIVLYLSFVLPLWLFVYKTKLVTKSRFKMYVSFGTILYCLHYLHLYHLNAFNSVLMRGYDVIEQPIRIQGLTKRFVDESIKVLEHSVTSDKPVMLFVSWHLTHTPLQPMSQFAGKSTHGKYGDCVEEMDWGVGEIMAALDRLDITDNTIVYFTSDHGGHIEEMVDSNGGYNGIYRGGKGWGAAEGSIRVPGLIKWPGRLPVKYVVQEPTSLMDIFPTLSDIMGVALPTDRSIDGRNILQNLKGNLNISPHEFLMHYCADDIQAVTYIPQKDKRVWKIAFKIPDVNSDSSQCKSLFPYIDRVCSCSFSKTFSPPLLFELMSDPGETTLIDVNSNEAYQELVTMANKAVKEHDATLGKINSSLSGFNLIWHPHLQLCCNFPFCSCSETLP